jgi:hypothetical protein
MLYMFRATFSAAVASKIHSWPWGDSSVHRGLGWICRTYHFLNESKRSSWLMTLPFLASLM